MTKLTAALGRLLPELIALVGVVLGVLVEIQTYFHSGRLPTAVEVAGVVAGTGLPLGSIAAYMAHRLGISKAALNHDISLAHAGYIGLSSAVSALEHDFPGVKAAVASLDSSVAERFHQWTAHLQPQPQPQVQNGIVIPTPDPAPAPEPVTPAPAAVAGDTQSLG